jgi:hypothetical protein
MLAKDGETAIRVAHNAVQHADRTPSFIELPIAPSKTSGRSLLRG